MKIFSIFFIFLFTLSIPVLAADFTVNLTTDEHDATTADNICDTDLAAAGEQCTLRAAIEQANVTFDGISVIDRVLFNLPADSTVILTEANGGQIYITTGVENRNRLEIIGTGADNLTIDGGAGGSRIFLTTADTKISGVTLTGGDGSDGSGGAILGLAGSLTLDKVHVTSNTSPSSGGAVSAVRTAVSNSTFSDNSAGNCGGIEGIDVLTIFNSTFSGNAASNNGGGICSGNSLSLRNSTVTGNTAGTGGGVRVNGFQFDVSNTIIAGNTATSGSAPEIFCDGVSFVSQGNNLIGDSAGDAANTGTGNITFQTTDILNRLPMLGALQNYGGTTPTHSILTGSPAINSGKNEGAPATDQRGFTRIFNGIIDIGAYESTFTKSQKRIRFF